MDRFSHNLADAPEAAILEEALPSAIVAAMVAAPRF